MSTPAHAVAVRFAREGFELEVDLGWDERVCVLFGPSGSGKSTLLELVLGLLPARDARVRIGGRELHGMPPEARDLGWVPQDAGLFPHLTVGENVAFGARRAGATASREVARAIEVLELARLRHRRPHELSGGERQRVAIARALASAPRALLLDEPLASLDLPLRARVLPYLLRVRDELGLPMLYITHDPDEAQLVGERIFVLDEGRVVARGAPRETLWSHAVLPLAEALGLENVLEAHVVVATGATLQVETRGGLGLVLPAYASLPTGSTLRLSVRAQDVLIAADPPGRISARNVLPARVVRCEATSDGVHVHLDAGEPLVAKVTADAARELELEAGASVHLVIKAQALRRIG